uniref:Uncharacterized protein n=1 Tax=Anopheles atroparvus TaxID=41427 RepID=A0AAG5D410_ANOAO
MMKIVCLAALIAVVAAMPNGPSPVESSSHDAAPVLPIMRQEVDEPEAIMGVEKQGSVDEAAVEAQDDMDKAETFGFGYHKVIHVHVPSYPAYHHYYPRYYPSHYHGVYW